MRKARIIAGLGALVDPENRWDLSYSSIRVGFNLVSGIPYDTHYTLHSRGGNGNAKRARKKKPTPQNPGGDGEQRRRQKKHEKKRGEDP